MKVKSISKTAYECPSCSEPHVEKPDKIEAWKLDDVQEIDGEEYALSEPEKVEIYRHECEGLSDELPEYSTAYQCGECETVYMDKDEAKECCKS